MDIAECGVCFGGSPELTAVLAAVRGGAWGRARSLCGLTYAISLTNFVSADSALTGHQHEL